jgi:hypothetical protein
LIEPTANAPLTFLQVDNFEMILQPINLPLKIITPNRPRVGMVISDAMVKKSQNWDSP